MMIQFVGNEEFCYWVIDYFQEFFYGEMSEYDVDVFCCYIVVCENCMDEVDMEVVVF